MNRRDFLKLGSLSALGLSLPDAFRLRALSASAGQKKMPNCILVWLAGGPSHLDTFDLKPDAPAEVRGDFRPNPKLAKEGIYMCEHFKRLPEHMDKLCIVRSMTSELGEHSFGANYMLTGHKPSAVINYPAYGSVVAHVLKERPILPPNVAIPNFINGIGQQGYLPTNCRPFDVAGDPSKKDFRVPDLDSEFGIARIDRRRALLEDMDNLSKRVEESSARIERDSHFEQAYKLIASKDAKKAFDLESENPKVRDRYGRHRMGQSLLMARRLVDAGCPFVSVIDTEGRGAPWDTHQSIVRQLKEGFAGGNAGLIPKLDQGLSALLTDLKQSGRIDDTLVLVMGEFGRTPKINVQGGRDHWPRAFSAVLAGAGVAGGKAVGKSDPRGESPAEDPVTPADLAKTIYSLLGIDPDREFQTSDGRPIPLTAQGKVVGKCIR